MSWSPRIAAGVVTALVTALVAATGVVPAQAAPTWLPKETVSGAPFDLTVWDRIAVDRFGNATAVWYQTAAGMGRVQAAHRPAGGSWGAPLTISDPTRFASAPDVVVDDSGTVTAAWSADGPGTADQIESARLPLGGVWSSPTLVGVSQLAGPRLAVDDAGVVTAVWLEFRTKYLVRTSSIAPGGTWAIGKDLSDTTLGSAGPQVAVDPATGATVAVWQTFDGTHSLIYASRRPPGGAWSSAQLVSEAGQDASSDPQVTINNQGTATVLFGKYFSGHYEAYWSSAPAGGSWSAPLAMSTPGHVVAERVVVSAPTGETLATWREDLTGTYVVMASTRPAGGAWTAPVPLSDGLGNALSVGAGTAPDGTAYVLWTWVSPTDDHPLQLARRPPGGAWSAPLDLAPATTSSVDAVHSIGFDDDGDVAVSYLEGYPNPVAVAVRALDGAGPATSLTGPAAATTGKAAAFSATATDHWSSVASYTWQFGDGGTATGPAATHVYAKPGSYTATLTVTDSVGNATTRTNTVAVTAAIPAIQVFKLTKSKIQALPRHGGSLRDASSLGSSGQAETVVTDLLDQRLATKTKLKVKLNTASTLKLVFKSKHKHLVKGKKKYVKVVVRKLLPAGLSKITVKAKVKGKKLKPDTYVIKGTAKNATGKSPKKKVELRVVP